jgi:hypothetical protein
LAPSWLVEVWEKLLRNRIQLKPANSFFIRWDSALKIKQGLVFTANRTLKLKSLSKISFYL